MIRFLLVLIFTLFSLEGIGAGFDCSKSQTKIEKFICANAELSSLDSKLDEIYAGMRKSLRADEQKNLVAKQTHWLKNSRNSCPDASCLQGVYQARIKELDPLADNYLSCGEMRRYPELVFSENYYIDLGSGNLGPQGMDEGCPESLGSLPFLKTLLDLAERIRDQNAPQECTGSMIHAQWRYYALDLTKAGFAPLLYLNQAKKSNQELIDHPGENGPWPYDAQLDYFKQWSQESFYNFQLYRRFFAEFDNALVSLKKHYQKAYGLDEAGSEQAARHALLRIATRAAGSFPHRGYAPESPLVKLAGDTKTKPDDLRSILKNAADAGESLSNQQLYRMLKAALLNQHSSGYLSIIVDRLGANFIASPPALDEPLLSFSLQSLDNLRYLLSKGAPVDAENDFGKTALFYAIGINNHAAVELLLNNRADVNHAYKSAEKLRPGGDSCVYPRLLHTQRTPLMHAAQNSDVRMLELLLRNGTQQNAVDELGFNALDYAVMGRNGENEAFLKALGLEQGVPKYTEGANGNDLKPVAGISQPGFIKKLAMSPKRPDILLALITPWDKVISGEEHGLMVYLRFG